MRSVSFEDLVLVRKNGKGRKRQRYLCKSCGRNFIKGDKRLKYGLEIKIQVLIMSLNNVGNRAIGRILNIPYQYVSNWIKKGVVYYQTKDERR